MDMGRGPARNSLRDLFPGNSHPKDGVRSVVRGVCISDAVPMPLTTPSGGFLLPRQESFPSLHILTRTAPVKRLEALPSAGASGSYELLSVPG